MTRLKNGGDRVEEVLSLASAGVVGVVGFVGFVGLQFAMVRALHIDTWRERLFGLEAVDSCLGELWGSWLVQD